jgi:fluoroacetyl-CoA thioesterase
MKASPKVGTTGEQRFVVEPRHAIDFADGGMPAVLATPWLIWFLEHAAREAVLPLLEPGDSTVGSYVELRHLTPTPLAQTVTCRARVVQVEGAVISFQLEAHDERERIAKGFHRLQVIRVDRFACKLRRKRLADLLWRDRRARRPHADGTWGCMASRRSRPVKKSLLLEVNRPPQWPVSK